ncbi:MAG: molecular chaperone TorD family protein, partial [candidate division KSB1 bacterium]|nr:molecular chaperone TorD family protein [candidate division KSB1 bacterium]
MNVNEIDLALCRSAIYEALALGFRPPAEVTITRLVLEYNNLALAEIASMLENDSSNPQKDGLASRVRRLSQLFKLESLQKSYRHLFGFTAHPQVPPYETEYGEEALFQQPQELGDIAGFYSAFGLKVNAFERVDHISCECEFLCFLNRKEAYALEENDADMLKEI